MLSDALSQSNLNSKLHANIKSLDGQRKRLIQRKKLLLETKISDDGVYKITPGCELLDTGRLLLISSICSFAAPPM